MGSQEKKSLPSWVPWEREPLFNWFEGGIALPTAGECMKSLGQSHSVPIVLPPPSFLWLWQM